MIDVHRDLCEDYIPKGHLHIQVTYLDEYSKVLQKADNYLDTQMGNRKFNPTLRKIIQEPKKYCHETVPDSAKLDRAKPVVRIPTTSQGGNPKSTEDKVMQTAGDTKAMVWQIFLTYNNNKRRTRRGSNKL